jgi:hypothetical protein
VSRDYAVVQDVGDVRLRGEEAEGGGVVLPGGRLDGGDAEVLVALEETSSGGGDTGRCVAGNGGVTIDDQVAVGGGAVRVDLCAGERRGGECQEDGREWNEMEPARAGRGKSGLAKGEVTENGHGYTS